MAEGKRRALKGMLATWEQRKARRKSEGEQVADGCPRPCAMHKSPPSLSVLLAGPGRPPWDALCLLRVFLAVPLLGVGDAPTSVHRLLHSNPTFAHYCDFLSCDVLKQAASGPRVGYPAYRCARNSLRRS